MIPAKPEAFKLMMAGSEALADVEENGMRIDIDYLDRAIEWSGNKAKELEQQLRSDDIFKMWRKIYGEGADLGKRNQLADIIFNQMGFECKHRTKTGKPKTDEGAFEDVDLPFVKRWVDYQKLQRTRTTDLIGVRRECDEYGFLHPFFHLHFASTFRSSSSSPNFQNKPNRDKRLAALIRKAFIPRDGHVLLEVDYGALEFRGAAIFWNDPAMIAYASDPSLDIHRDTAAECYLLETGDVTKDARSYAKNKFVFPILYGSYWRSVAVDLWNFISRAKLATKNGKCLYEHLKEKGISELGDSKHPSPGTFYHHIKQVEQDFNERFSHWSNQKQVWWEQYLKNGEFPLLTGFVCRGKSSYNNLMNTPIQGMSFHFLLWSLIQLNDWLRNSKMRTMIVGQIHDSLIIDAHRDELDDVVHTSKRVMTQDVRDHWKWISTPLEVEFEICRRNWFEKEELAV